MPTIEVTAKSFAKLSLIKRAFGRFLWAFWSADAAHLFYYGAPQTHKKCLGGLVLHRLGALSLSKSIRDWAKSVTVVSLPCLKG